MLDVAVVCWLARSLTEAPFVRMYVEEETLSPRAFEDAFWSLPPDGSCPSEARARAWGELSRDVLAGGGVTHPTEWFCALVMRLRTRDRGLLRRALHGRVYPALWGDAHEDTRHELRYAELHCHLLGSVPFDAMWQRWCEDEWARTALRRPELKPCVSGAWSRTWAELVERVAVDHKRLGGFDGACAKLNDPADAFAARRYLAVRAGLYRALIYQRGIEGLTRFSESYNRYGDALFPARATGFAERWIYRDLVRVTLERFEREGAESVELRPTLRRSRRETQERFQQVLLGYFDYLRDAARPVAMALVPSLFKQQGVPGEDAERLETPEFWDEQSDVWCEQVEQVLAMITEEPALRYFIVGLDAAGKEMGCPPGVLAPAFERVRDFNRRHAVDRTPPGRDFSVRALSEIAAGSDPFACFRAEGVPFARIGLTVHAGEDFRDPMTGLRHIWEAVDALGLSHGDRVGHAIAASLNTERARALLDRRVGAGVEMVNRDRRVLMPRGTHLADLAWLVDTSLDANEGAYLEQHLAAAIVRAYGAPTHARRAVRAFRRRASSVSALIPGVRFGDPAQVGSTDLEWVTIGERWLSVFEDRRARLMELVSKRGVVIESCPSSNRVVCGLDRSPLEYFIEDGFIAHITVATDDPGLLDAWPRKELHDVAEHRVRLLDQNRRASFIRRVGEGS